MEINLPFAPLFSLALPMGRVVYWTPRSRMTLEGLLMFVFRRVLWMLA